MILIDDHAHGLDALAEQHFQNLNAVNQPAPGEDEGEYWAWSLIGRISSRKNISEQANQPLQVDFWNYLLDHDQQKLKAIIKGRPQILKAIIAEIEAEFGQAFFSNHISYTQATLTPFGQTVSNTFAYETLYRSQNECATNFLALNLEHCPYCNTHPLEVVVFSEELEGAARSRVLHQLDHFYPRSRYPYLGLSFFNLIPGCYTCNAQLKLQKNFDIDTHFNPYHRRLDDNFTFEVNTLIPESREELQFSYIRKQASVYSEQSLTDFDTISRYNNPVHKRSVYDMLNEWKNYSTAVLASSMHQIAGLAENDDQAALSKLKSMGVPPSQAEINNYCLGKLKRDICLQMASV